ncbi:hypothetical protein BGZ93_004245 [Podila epicladia]|nr:hypothetical protein BGZ93_004245 [Podila epicladia]
MDTEPTDQSQDKIDQDDVKANQEQKKSFVMSLSNTSQQVLDFTASLNRLWAPPKLRASFSDMSFNASKSRENHSASPPSPVSTSWSPDPAAFSSPTTQIIAQPRMPMMRREMSMPSLGAGLDFWSKASTSNTSEKNDVTPVQETSSSTTDNLPSLLSVIEGVGRAGLTSPPRSTDSSTVIRTATNSKSKASRADRSRPRDESLFHPYRRPSSEVTPASSSSSQATGRPQATLVDLLQGPSLSSTPHLGRAASFSGTDRPAPVLKRQASTSAIKEFLPAETPSTANAAKAT